jgi:hypothetical protein
MKTALGFVVCLVLVGCAMITPREVADNRRDLVAPKIGCLPVDTKVAVEEDGAKPFKVSCKEKQYLCRGSVTGFPNTYVINCEHAD